MSDAKANMEPADSNKFKLDFNGLLAMGVKDEASFQKVVTGAEKFMGKDDMSKEFPITLTDKMMVISNGDYAGKYLENKTQNNSTF